MKKYNTLSQEKFDKFIDSLIDNGKINSKSDFAKLMRLDFQGIYDKEMLNNRRYREKELKIDLALKASSIFKVNINYFYDDTTPISINPLEEHKLDSLKIKELSDEIIVLNDKLDSFIEKTNSEKGEVLIAFKKDAKNLLNALNEATMHLIVVISRTKLLAGETNDFSRFLNEDDIILNIKNTKAIIDEVFDNLDNNYSNKNLFNGFVKLRDEYLIVDNYRFIVMLLEKMLNHFFLLNKKAIEIRERVELLIEMFEKFGDSLSDDMKEDIESVLVNSDELSYIINLYIIINLKQNILMMERKYYDYKIEIEKELKNQIYSSFALDNTNDYVDYKTIYEKTYELILLSISNENAIFEYINKFEQKLFSKINLLRNFIR